MSGNERKDFITDVLTLALSYSPEKEYKLKFYNADVPKVRVFRIIEKNAGIDIIAAGATTNREKRLLPVRFPIYKGLFGWRIPLVNGSNKQLFSEPLNTTQFKTLVAGQLFSWSDTKILESNGIQVEKGSDYEGLFHMLEKERFDYFPRSVLEVAEEFKKHSHLNIALDSNVMIHYPTAYYYYLNKENTELAEDIAFGLEQALLDGQYESLFNKYHQSLLSSLNLKKRRVIELENPFLTKQTPLSRKQLWIDLSQ